MRDKYCETISSLLVVDGQSAPRTLAKLQERSGLVRSTLLRHLSHQQRLGLITKEQIPRGGRRGRPKVLYSISEPDTVAEMRSRSDDRITIPFPALKLACRHRTRTTCKMTQERCMVQLCPVVSGNIVPFSLGHETNAALEHHEL